MENVGKNSKKKTKPKKVTEKQLEEKRRKCRERVAKCRAKMSEEKKAAKREKDREYKQNMKEQGVIKSIKDLSNRDQRKKRKQWKKYSSNYRKRNSEIKEVEVVAVEENLGRKGSPQVQAGRKCAKRTYDDMQRTINKMKTELEKKSRQIETLRKKVYCAKNPKNEVLSPQTKDENVRKFEDFQVAKAVKRTFILTIQLAYDKKLREGVTLLHYAKLGPEDKVPFLKETLLLRSLSHKNIIEFYGTVYQSSVDREYLSFETYECYLSQLLSDDHKELFEPPVVKCVIQQLLTGLQYLHNKEIVHRNITPKNLVITEKGLLKISNFRSSLMLNERIKAIEADEFGYQPVNVLLEDKSIFTADDIWSATCIFSQLVLKKKLFESITSWELLKEIFLILGFPDESKWPEFLELPNYKYLIIGNRPSINWLSSFFEEKQSLDLVQKGFCYNPKERISAEEFVLHPYFFKEPLAIDLKSFGLKLNGRSYKFPVK